MRPRLVIFDVDGTLIDSQAHIVGAMSRAFAGEGLRAPARAAILSIVGLSLPEAIARLTADHAPEAMPRVPALVAAYKDAFAVMRTDPTGAALSPLYPGARAALDALAARPDTLLAIATGKSRRGMAHVFDLHDMAGMFQSVQVADDHPSKPHPAMVEACLRETGVAEADAVLVGDTVFDMEMARLGGITGIGVSWGYHRPEALQAAGAAAVLERFDALIPLLERVWGGA
jgi:phosphoglycolate phosphatase